MTLFLQFNNTPAPSPEVVFPPDVKYDIEGRPVDSNGFPYPLEEKITRPFVPSVAPEDLEKAMEIGILTPRSVSALDQDPAPFVSKKPTWLEKAKGVAKEEDHIKKHKQLLDDIEFLQMIEEQENHEEMLDEAANWIEEQEKILWAPSTGMPSVMADLFDIQQTNIIPQKTIQEIKIVRVEQTWSLASIAGQICVYLPWGSETNREGPPAIKQPLLNQKPLWNHEFVCAELEYSPNGRNLWKATKILPKLKTEGMLVSMVESKTDYESYPKTVTRSGYQYTYEIPCDPANIGSIIGQGGKNINALIQSIQKPREEKWYGPMPDHIDVDYPEFPLPEVTITPVEAPEGYSGFSNSFIPQKADVRVFCPTCSIWDKAEVEALVSYMHC